MNLLSVNPFHLQTHPAIVNEHRLTDVDNIPQSSVGNGKRFRGAAVALVRDEGHLLTILEFYHSLADRAHSNLWNLQVLHDRNMTVVLPLDLTAHLKLTD